VEQWASLQGVKKGRIQVSLDLNPSTPSIQAWAPDQEMESTTQEFREEGGLRHRAVGGRGKLKLNLLYDENREELKVFVHEALDLPGGDLPDPPDPQVKIYLMPGKKKKKKTEVVKDSVNPRFDEEFDFSIDFNKLPQHSIKLSVVDKKGVFSKSPVMGSITISLNNPGLRQGLADWYPLEEDDEDSD